MAFQVALHISEEFQNSCYEMTKKPSVFENEAGRKGVRNAFLCCTWGPAKII
jgi:hypothetical protein